MNYSVKQLTQSLQSLYSQASPKAIQEGSNWYPSARLYYTQLARKYHLKPSVVLGVVAALSPFVSWSIQLSQTEEFIRNELKRKGTGRFPGFKSNLRSARNILSGTPVLQALKGPKVRAFYLNLIGRTNHLTLDRHAISAALGAKVEGANKPVLNTIRDAYRVSAGECGLPLSSFQAIIWSAWKANVPPKRSTT